MRREIEASFQITGWEETDLVDDDGVRIYRTDVAKVFAGEIQGTSQAWLVMAITPSGRAYNGLELLDVSVQGRKGTFVLKHDAIGTDSGQEAEWVIVPGSGTGDLAGLAGTARIDRADDGSHHFTLVVE